MKILINNDAKDYIEEKTKDNSVTIVVVNTGSGWCPSFQPSVKMGKPNDENGFKMFKAGDTNVYIKGGLKSKGDKVEITMGKFLWKKYLNVNGLSL